MNKIKVKLKNPKLPSNQQRERIKSLASANVNAGSETRNLRRKAKM
jgi:hypothetical protein